MRSAQDKATRKRSENATAKSREPATEQLADDIAKLKMNFRAAACAISPSQPQSLAQPLQRPLTVCSCQTTTASRT